MTPRGTLRLHLRQQPLALLVRLHPLSDVLGDAKHLDQGSLFVKQSAGRLFHMEHAA